MLKKQTMALVLLAAVGVASYLIILPFFSPILAGAILAILFRPVYKWTLRYITSPSMAAFLVCFCTIVLVAGSLFLLGNAFIGEVKNIAGDLAAQNVSSAQVSVGAFQFGQRAIAMIPGGETINFNALVIEGVKSGSDWLRVQLLSIPDRLLRMILTVFMFFFLLRDGRQFISYIYDGLPLTKREQQLIETRLSQVTYAVVYGQLLTAIIQGLIAMLGYELFGIGAPVLLGVATMFASLIPLFGTTIIWVPAAIYLIATGHTVWPGLGLLLWGAIVIHSVDTFVRPWLIGASSRVHTALALLGVLGGVVVFGFVGIFAGPVILALFVTLYDVFIRKEAN